MGEAERETFVRGVAADWRQAVEDPLDRALCEYAEKLTREPAEMREADVVKLRVVWGLEMREIAAALGISLATVERDWAFAKAWLVREGRASPPTAGS